jgi:hypothetical protein
MSQSHDPSLDEVKRALRRLEALGQQSALAASPGARQPPGLNQRLAALSQSHELPAPSLGGIGSEDAAADQPAARGLRPKAIFAVTLVTASAAALALFAGVSSFKRETASPRLPEVKSSVALGPAFPAPQVPIAPEETRMDAAAEKLASTPRLVAPAEWTAPAGATTKLPLSFQSREDARNYQVLVSGLEASAFIVKGVEIISGTWIIPANELAGAVITRTVSAPRRTITTFELRTESGEVVSQTSAILFASESDAAITNR